MGDNIPDEILSEILSPALRVSDDAFATTSETSPFMSMSESSSAFLLVSKAWLRVATPLLYNVVIIRSKAQAQALAVVLTSNPAFGKFIRKLRVEGGYGISMLKILQTSPNITDIFLCLDINSPDNACGLRQGLHLIDPVRVIIHGGYGPHSVHLYPERHKLGQKIAQCILTWTKMSVFDMSPRPKRAWGSIASEISMALSTAPKLVTLLVSNYRSIVYFLGTIAVNPSLQRIQVKAFDSLPVIAQRAYIDEVKKWSLTDKRFWTLFNLPDEWPLPEDTPAPFVYPARLAAEPLQEDGIWSRILHYALRLNPSSETFNASSTSYIAPLLVSKKFARLGIPHLYANPVLQKPAALGSFADRLSQHPPLGHHVRRLKIIHHGDLNLLRLIISHTPSLVDIYGGAECLPIAWESFNDLGNFTGSTLSSFEGVPILKASASVDPAVFKLLPRMRNFGWDSPVFFKTEPELIPVDTFNNLVQLTVCSFDPSFLEMLSNMELPSLRTAFFSATAEGGIPFFQKHGRKLEHLAASVKQIADPALAIFDNCPSITILGISCDEKTIISTSGFNPPDKHTRLERIVFRLPEHLKSASMKRPQQISLGRFLPSLDITPFPALRQIEHPHCFWPTTDRDISRSPWVRWAESLLERNVQLVGSGEEGVPWRRRLKYVPQKSK